MDEVEDEVEVKDIEDRARDLCLEAERVPDQLRFRLRVRRPHVPISVERSDVARTGRGKGGGVAPG